MTHFLTLPEGRIAYDDTEGDGPLMVLVPGIGDLRSTWRLVKPALVEAGYRVVTMDLRGHGESDATFDRYDGEAVGQDVVALLRHLDAGPAALVGNSLAAGSAVYVAAEAPELVSAIVLEGGFTRGPNVNWAMLAVLRLVMGGPWRVVAWLGMHDTLFPSGKPADHAEHRAAMRRNLREPGRSAALGAMMTSRHDHAEQRYARVKARCLFVMGSADSDFPDPEQEAREVAEALGGAVAMIDGAGHYPHAETPQRFARVVLGWLEQDRALAS